MEALQTTLEQVQPFLGGINESVDVIDTKEKFALVDGSLPFFSGMHQRNFGKKLIDAYPTKQVRGIHQTFNGICQYGYYLETNEKLYYHLCVAPPDMRINFATLQQAGFQAENNVLGRITKDTTHSCVFDFPDRPNRPIPPIDGTGHPPDTYPYDPHDDWNPPPIYPPDPNDDPDADGHPATWEGVFINTTDMPFLTHGDTSYQLIGYSMLKQTGPNAAETVLEIGPGAVDTSITGIIRNETSPYNFYFVGRYYVTGAVNPPGVGPYYYPVNVSVLKKRPPTSPSIASRSFTAIDGNDARLATFQTLGVSVSGFSLISLSVNLKLKVDGMRLYVDFPPFP